jgi:hypothetical protein
MASRYAVAVVRTIANNLAPSLFGGGLTLMGYNLLHHSPLPTIATPSFTKLPSIIAATAMPSPCNPLASRWQNDFYHSDPVAAVPLIVQNFSQTYFHAKSADGHASSIALWITSHQNTFAHFWSILKPLIFTQLLSWFLSFVFPRILSYFGYKRHTLRDAASSELVEYTEKLLTYISALEAKVVKDDVTHKQELTMMREGFEKLEMRQGRIFARQNEQFTAVQTELANRKAEIVEQTKQRVKSDAQLLSTISTFMKPLVQHACAPLATEAEVLKLHELVTKVDEAALENYNTIVETYNYLIRQSDNTLAKVATIDRQANDFQEFIEIKVDDVNAATKVALTKVEGLQSTGQTTEVNLSTVKAKVECIEKDVTYIFETTAEHDGILLSQQKTWEDTRDIVERMEPMVVAISKTVCEFDGKIAGLNDKTRGMDAVTKNLRTRITEAERKTGLNTQELSRKEEKTTVVVNREATDDRTFSITSTDDVSPAGAKPAFPNPFKGMTFSSIVQPPTSPTSDFNFGDTSSSAAFNFAAPPARPTVPAPAINFFATSSGNNHTPNPLSFSIHAPPNTNSAEKTAHTSSGPVDPELGSADIIAEST